MTSGDVSGGYDACVVQNRPPRLRAN